MLRALLLLLTAALLPIQNANQPVSDFAAVPYDDREAYAVYAVVIPNDWLVRAAHAKTLLIRTETEPHEMCVKPDDDAEGRLVKLATEDYEKANAVPWLLQRNFNLDQPYELLPWDETPSSSWFQRPGLGGWEEFRVRYPDSYGWMELSAVGFNPEKTVAVVYMGHSCGNLCAGGGFTVLRKEAGKWKPMKFRGRSCYWDA
jgi:hypothetical protein